MKSAKAIALTAGFTFISLSIIVQALIPSAMEETNITEVLRTVRTPLGELREARAEAEPYTALEERGRQVYIREGCWYCHSQYVRPVAREQRRWGPVSQVGEYAFDTPHLFGTRRIGPDLTRVGGKYGDDWHIVHFFNARMIVPDSIMPAFTWLFQEKGGRQVLNEEGRAVTAYVQKLGMNRGKWRDTFPSQIITAGSGSITTRGSVEHGRLVYEKRCMGCHGEEGDGKGPAAGFFEDFLPRDFTSGVYKFRTTPSGSLPLDSDIYRTITMGIRDTAMPPWFMLSEDDRWDVIQFIKTFSPDFEDFGPDPPIYVPDAPAPDPGMIERGREVYALFKCSRCHGEEGKGDGPSADTLTDDLGNSIFPKDFTEGFFKAGPRPEDIFRTFMTGLDGTPMPSYGMVVSEEPDLWALSYFVLSLSADGNHGSMEAGQ